MEEIKFRLKVISHCLDLLKQAKYDFQSSFYRDLVTEQEQLTKQVEVAREIIAATM